MYKSSNLLYLARFLNVAVNFVSKFLSSFIKIIVTVYNYELLLLFVKI